MARQVFVRDGRRGTRGEDEAMRVVIYAMVMAVIALGLLMFEDIRVGLPVLTVAVWAVVLLTGLFLVVRLHRRPRTRRRVRRGSRNMRMPAMAKRIRPPRLEYKPREVLTIKAER
jgi:transcriptional regulator of nitric oxide reductase